MGASINYAPTETGLAFHNSEAKVKGIAGSPGSGKSVACAMEIMYIAMRQKPDDNNIRRIRAGVIRTTYPELKKTTRKTIVDWLPPNSGRITSSAPMEGIITFGLGDGTTVEIDYQFLALDTENDLKKLDSMELSVIYLNEANHMSEAHFIKCLERIGRFPSPKDGAMCSEPTLIIDFNLPGKEHWLYQYLVLKDFKETPKFTKSQIELFVQPPAVFCENFSAVERGEEEPVYVMNENAENLHNLPDGYYDIQLAMNTWEVTKARLLMIWTSQKLGKTIHPEFDIDVHVSKGSLEIVPHEPVFIGLDQSGVHPCATLHQLVRGQQRVYREIFGNDTSLDDFVQGLLLPALAKDFPRCETLAILDPSNTRQSNGGVLLAPTAILQDKYGIRSMIAPGGNAMDTRISAVSRQLRRRDALIIDPSCKMLIEGLDSKYVFKHIRGMDGQVIHIKKKVDNQWGHYVDSFQNVVLFVNKHFAESQEETIIVRRKRLL